MGADGARPVHADVAGVVLLGSGTGGGIHGRARCSNVLQCTPQRCPALRYLDFGNLEAGVPAARVAPLDAARAALPPAAVECRLAHVRAAAVDDEAGEACARALHELVWGKGLELAEVPGRADGPRFRVRVVDGVAEAKAGGDSRPTVNEQLVERGLARVPGASKHAADDLAVAMRALQLGARAARAGVWRYGDCDFSDDEK